MTSFSKRLHSEIEYIGLNRKEFAAKAGIKKRALDAYLGPQQSMPPADIAVKIAADNERKKKQTNSQNN